MKVKKDSILMVFMVLALFCLTPEHAVRAAKTEVEFANGEILFPGEKTIPPVKISGLKFSFPDGTPEEILFLKGKILTGKVFGPQRQTWDGSDTIYLILDSYDPGTRTLKLIHISDNFALKRPASRTNMDGEYNGLAGSNNVMYSSGGFSVRFYLYKDKKSGYIIELTYTNGNGVSLVPVAEIPIPEPAPKKEMGKAKIENGVISFSTDAPSVNIKDDLKFSFPSDSPKEVLAIKGKIYGGRFGAGKGKSNEGAMQYVIPLGYDSGTKTISLLKTTANEGTKSKPSKYILKGVYNGSEGSTLKRTNDNPNEPQQRFYIIPTKQGYDLRLLWSDGSNGDLSPIAEIPAS